MSKRILILILNGAPGAKNSGNEVIGLYISGMKINHCMGCMQCMSNSKKLKGFCAQTDDMEIIYEEFHKADVVVFASPVMWWGPSSQLKGVIDRLEGYIGTYGINDFSKKETALLMTYHGGGKMALQTWYSVFSELLGCKDLGFLIGSGTDSFIH